MAATLGDAVFYLRVNESELNAKLSAAEAKAREFAAKMQTAFDNVGKNASFSGISQGIDGLASKAASSATKLDSLKAAMDKAQIAANNADVAFKNQKANLAILEGQLNTAKTKYAEIADKLEAAKNATNKNEDAIKKLSAEYDRARKAVDAKQMALNNLNTRLTATESKLNTANTALNTAKDRYKTAGDAAATAATQKEKTAKSAEHVGTATGNARAGIDKMRDGLKGVEAQAHTTEGALQKIANGALNKIGALAVQGFGKLIELGKDAGVAIVKTAADYETTMNVLQDATGATDVQMKEVSRTAKALGADLELPNTSASGAAKAITELAKGGMTLDQAMKAAKGTLQLATIGLMDEAKAAEITSGAINMFKLSGEDATKVTNLLAAAANSSSGDVKDFADAMRMGGSVAAMEKVPIEDFTTATALMAQQGIKGSDAGTSLKTMFLSLQSPTDKAKDLMTSYGISVYDAQGKMKPLPDIMKQFSAALSDNATRLVVTGGATKKQANEAEKAAGSHEKLTSAIGFGNRQLEIAQKELIAMSGKAKVSQTAIEAKKLSIDKLKASLADKNDKLSDANGKIDAYAKATGTTRTAILQMTQEQRNQTLATIFGTDAVRAANAVLMAGEDAWNDMSGAVNKAGAAQSAAAAQTKGLAGAWSGLKSQLETVALTLGEPLLKPLAGVVNAMSGWVGGAGKQVEGFLGRFQTALTQFKDPLDALKQALITIFPPSVWGAINAGIDTLKKLRDTVDKLPATFAPLEAAVERLFNQVLPVATANSAGKFDALKTAIDTAIKLAGDIIIAFEPVVMGVFNTISEFLNKHGGEIGETISTAWDKIEKIIKDTGEVIKLAATLVFSAIAKFLADHGTEIQNVLSNAWAAIKLAINTTLAVINGIVQTALKILKGDWKGAFDEIKKTSDIVMQAILDLISLILRNIVKAAQDFYTNWKTSWTNALNAAEDIVKRGMENAKKMINQVLDDIIALIKGYVGQFSSAGANMIEGFIGGVKSKAAALIDAVGGVINGALGVVRRVLDMRSPSRVLFGDGGNALQGFINGVLNKSGPLNAAMRDTVTSATKVLIGEGASWGEVSKAITASLGEIRAKAKAEFDATHQITKTTTKAQREQIAAEWKAIDNDLKQKGEEIRAAAKTTWDGMKADQKTATEGIKNDQKDIWGDIADLIGEFTDEIRKTTVQEGFEEIRNAGSKFTRELADDTSDVWRELSAAVNEKAKEMRDAVKDGSKEQRAAVEADIKAMRADVQAKWREMGRDVRDASKEVRDAVSEAYKEMREDVADKLDIIKKTAQREWDAAKEAATKATAEAKKNNISDFTAIEAALKEKGEAIYNNAQKAYTDLKDGAARKLAEFKQNNQGAWDDIKKITVNTVRDILDEVVGGFNGMGNGANSAIDRLVNGAKSGMNAISESVRGAAEAVRTETQNIVGAIVPVMTTLEQFWQYVPGGIGGIDGRPSTQSKSWTDSFINQPSAPTTTPVPTQIRAKPPTESGPRVDRPEFASGGIASGPTSGYAATLHGTEAVVPLSGGRAIPVEIRGGMGDNSAAVVKAIEIMTTVLERAIKSSGGNISISSGGKSSSFSMADIARSGLGVRSA